MLKAITSKFISLPRIQEGFPKIPPFLLVDPKHNARLDCDFQKHCHFEFFCLTKNSIINSFLLKNR